MEWWRERALKAGYLSNKLTEALYENVDAFLQAEHWDDMISRMRLDIEVLGILPKEHNLNHYSSRDMWRLVICKLMELKYAKKTER